jgi:hypothetical protein
MMRAAVARVMISEYFCILQKPHRTGPEKKAQPSLWPEVRGGSIFSVNGWFDKQIAG